MSKKTDTSAAEELEILNPDREVTIRGEKLTVREFGFIEGMAMAAGLAPMIVDMGDLLASDKIGLDALTVIFAKHQAVWVDCMARAVGKDAEWVAGLGDEEGSYLSMTTWTVNRGFFIRRIMICRKEMMMREALAEAQAAASAPVSFTPASSKAATDSTT